MFGENCNSMIEERKRHFSTEVHKGKTLFIKVKWSFEGATVYINMGQLLCCTHPTSSVYSLRESYEFSLDGNENSKFEQDRIGYIDNVKPTTPRIATEGLSNSPSSSLTNSYLSD